MAGGTEVDELGALHRGLVNTLLAILMGLLPLLSRDWPERIPFAAAVSISILFGFTLVSNVTGRISTAKAAEILIVTMGTLSLGGSLLHVMHQTDPTVAFADERYNSTRALVLLIGGAYVTLGRRRGRRAGLLALAIWTTITVVVIDQFDTNSITSSEALGPLLDVIATALMAGLLFDVAALNARMLDQGRRRARRAAHVDALTAIANRSGLVPAMQAALDLEGEASLIVLDLDHFKSINDTHGHSGGDKILRKVALTLTAAARPGDTVGRWGGEEFVMVIQAGGRPAAERVAGRVRDALREIPADLPVSASFGVTLVQPGDTIESLFNRADRALYLAKSTGRDRVVTSWELADADQSPTTA